MSDDMALLRAYAERNCEESFAMLVSRHVNLVYSAAFRCLDNAHQAEEVTQAVFIILARKSAQLGSGTVLAGWLYNTTRLTAANFVRAEIRRRRREQEAYMQSLANSGPEQDRWEQIAPFFEEVMGELREKDRNAIVLRFMAGKSIKDVANAMGIKEGAAKKRVARAAEKLRTFFSKRGVTISTIALAGAISANSVHAAPTGLTTASAAAGLLKGSAVSGSVATSIKETLNIMAWAKFQTAVFSLLVIALVVGTTVVVAKKASLNSSTKIAWDLDDYSLWRVRPALIIRPTHFTEKKGQMQSGAKWIGRIQPMKNVVAAAYGVNVARVVAPPDLPVGDYDYIDTLPGDNPLLPFQTELRKQFNIFAHTEIRETNVLELKVKNPNSPGLVANEIPNGFSTATAIDFGLKSRPLSDLAKFLESRLDQIVTDQTGSTNRFDLYLRLDPLPKGSPPETLRRALEKALLDQLGLELIPTRASVEMLIVERQRRK